MKSNDNVIPFVLVGYANLALCTVLVISYPAPAPAPCAILLLNIVAG